MSRTARTRGVVLLLLCNIYLYILYVLIAAAATISGINPRTFPAVWLCKIPDPDITNECEIVLPLARLVKKY